MEFRCAGYPFFILWFDISTLLFLVQFTFITPQNYWNLSWPIMCANLTYPVLVMSLNRVYSRVYLLMRSPSVTRVICDNCRLEIVHVYTIYKTNTP